MNTIQTLIDNTLASQSKDHVSSHKFVPSSFGMCFRQQYWRRKDETKSDPPDERTLRVFAAGQLFHDFVQGILTKDNDCEIEILVECEDVKGFADLSRGNEIIDIKSQHSKSFWWMLKKDCDIKKEKYANWLQVLYYARELGKDFGRLVFVSKDDLCIQEYVQPLNEFWKTEIGNELATLRSMWRLDKLPPALPRCSPKKDGTYWMCNYCDWRSLCKEIEKT